MYRQTGPEQWDTNGRKNCIQINNWKNNKKKNNVNKKHTLAAETLPKLSTPKLNKCKNNNNKKKNAPSLFGVLLKAETMFDSKMALAL